MVRCLKMSPTLQIKQRFLIIYILYEVRNKFSHGLFVRGTVVNIVLYFEHLSLGKPCERWSTYNPLGDNVNSKTII
jgi:hypothetical protein